MEIVVIGCTHAGTAAVLNTKELHPDANITVYERNDNISFLSCGIALYVGGVVKDINDLFYSSPAELEKKGIKTCMRHDVVAADILEKKITVKNLKTNETFDKTFDKLIITSGSWPIVPKLPNIDLENILLCKNYSHAETIIEKSEHAKKIAVIGAGYIGIELVEAFKGKGKEVTIIDLASRVLEKYLDKDFTDLAEASFKREGITLGLGESVTGFEGKNGKVCKVLTNKNQYEADMVILCVGFRPNTDIFRGQIDMLPNGAIKVDEYMHTSKPDVLAAGDCCTVFYTPSEVESYIPLATNAVRQGTLAAVNLMEKKIPSLGVQGTSGIKIFENLIASTGMTAETALKSGFDVRTITVEDSYRPEFMPSHENVKFKIVIDKKDGRLLGAQIASKVDLTWAVNAMSICIQDKTKARDLAFIDFFFQPYFNKPWSFVNMAGLRACRGQYDN